MIKEIKICLGCLFVLSIIGCKTGGGTIQPIQDSKQISYEVHVKKIINKNCAGCHAEFTSLAGFKKAVVTSKALERINRNINPMPPSGLIDIADRKTIADWAKNNFKE